MGGHGGLGHSIVYKYNYNYIVDGFVKRSIGWRLARLAVSGTQVRGTSVMAMDEGLEASASGEWFARAISRPGSSRVVWVRGVPIHYLTWAGQEERPALLLVHGYRAHARWWDGIAPFLADDYRVAALDLSGMGDSGRRHEYDAVTFAEDIIAVVRDMNASAVTLIGHSFGGGRALRACVEAPELIGHVIVVDSYVQFPDQPSLAGERVGVRKTAYGDFAEACRRFRLTPAQPCALPQIVDHIARTSLRRIEGGWDWKFDRNLPAIIDDASEPELFSTLKARVDVLYGQFSAVMDPALARRVAGLFGNARGPIEIPEGHHHIMVSQPLALIGTLRALLARADGGRRPR